MTKYCPFQQDVAPTCGEWCPMHDKGDCLFAMCARKLIRVGEMLEELDKGESESKA